MLQLEVVVVVVGLRSEANLLDRDLRLVGLQLLCLFLLLVEELLVIGDAAHGGIGFGRNLDQVELHLVRELECVADREYDGLFDVVADHAHLGCRDLVVDTVRIIRFFRLKTGSWKPRFL